MPINRNRSQRLACAGTNHPSRHHCHQHSHHCPPTCSSFYPLPRVPCYGQCTETTSRQLCQQHVPTHTHTHTHCITGFANATMHQMLIQFYATYRCLSPAGIQANNARIKANSIPTNQLKHSSAKLKMVLLLPMQPQPQPQPPQPKSLAAIAYNLIFSTEMFPNACRKCIELN